MTTNTTVAPPGDNAPLKDGLSLRGVTKRFGTLTANDHIDLDIVPGRIHCCAYPAGNRRAHGCYEDLA